jgi:integrase
VAEIARSTSLGRTHPAVIAAVDWLALRNSSDTASSAVSNFVPWFEYCSREGIDPLQASKYQARAYLAEQTSAGYAPTTLNLRAAVLRSFFADAIDEGVAAVNPFHRIRAGNTDPMVPTPSLTLEQTGRVAHVARNGLAGRGLIGQRNGAMAYLMIRVGPRRKEVAIATWGALSRIGEGLTWQVHGKANRWGPTVLPADATAILGEWRALLETAIGRPVRPDDPLFPALGNRRSERLLAVAAAGPLPDLDRATISRVFKALLISVSIEGPRYSAHAARATAATLGYEATKDIVAVQRMMRHRSQETTMRYIRTAATGTPASAWEPPMPAKRDDPGDDAAAPVAA